jgi:hypothetical protein
VLKVRDRFRDFGATLIFLSQGRYDLNILNVEIFFWPSFRSIIIEGKPKGLKSFRDGYLAAMLGAV